MDESDIAQRQREAFESRALQAIRERAAKIEQGEPGECAYCGEHSMRLIRSACAPCRDRRRLP